MFIDISDNPVNKFYVEIWEDSLLEYHHSNDKDKGQYVLSRDLLKSEASFINVREDKRQLSYYFKMVYIASAAIFSPKSFNLK